MSRTIELPVYDWTRTIMLLDAAQDALDDAADREKRREAGKRLRQVSNQQRAKATRAHIAEMMAKYALEFDK